MERQPNPSVVEYVLRVKKLEVANCEAISHALAFEGEMNAWMDEMDMLDGKKRKEEEKND